MSSGSISAMIASLKANKRTRVSTFDKIKGYKKSDKSELHFDKKASPTELKKIKKRVQKENDASSKRKIVILIISIIVLLTFLYTQNRLSF
ncbi:hypothetical protein H9W90_10765 [Polaribacter pectinis]|uniref:Uncharacterized protein n=1 Tax=Polaribacter pectinis TaxID=2738844 RepID=A0A7G9L7S9_9FLAO|nr:hypothetical protein [Polaribacter pectinis]QNM84678.1 hypothetical protein H9W90_10765 [Polaribacter pectinis]